MISVEVFMDIIAFPLTQISILSKSLANDLALCFRVIHEKTC